MALDGGVFCFFARGDPDGADWASCGTFPGRILPHDETFLGGAVACIPTKEGLMSFYRCCKSLPHRFRLVLSSFLQHDGLPFADVLGEAQIERVFDGEQAAFAEVDDAIYTPAVTLWAFLSQVL